ncbi:MAG: ribonuclease E activity regulator RraA [Rhodospirillales bacterium]|nr:ribonuclease E activity regulator RraA [Alphaproteobacteria bacterium]MCB9982615.1 ribonuclease E activity regulator RraA [Rhodospirillales bacterium]
MKSEMISTANLCDENENIVIFDHAYKHYGLVKSYAGIIQTISIDEDNAKIIETLKQNGEGQVLIVKVKGKKCAVIGDRLSGIAISNGWKCIIVDGYIRDIEEINNMNIGIWAKGTYPKRSTKKAKGTTGETLTINNTKIIPKQQIYLDQDGIVIQEK